MPWLERESSGSFAQPTNRDLDRRSKELLD
jgi:hypothetical protein